jgi:hypothetical protein
MEEGFDDSKYSEFLFLSSGQFYSNSNQGKIKFHSNRTTIDVNFCTNCGDKAVPVKVNADQSIWLLGADTAYLVKKDQIIRRMPMPRGHFSFLKNKPDKPLLLLSQQNNKLVIHTIQDSAIQSYPSNLAVEKDFFALQTLDHRLWFFNIRSDSMCIYLIDETYRLSLIKKYKSIKHLVHFQNEENLIAYNNTEQGVTGKMFQSGQLQKDNLSVNNYLSGSLHIYSNFNSIGAIQRSKNHYELVIIDSLQNFTPHGSFESKDGISSIQSNLSNHFFIVPTLNNVMLVNRTIKKYPYIFESGSANSIFTLQEDSKGRIWAGSYQGDLAIIDHGQVVLQKKYPFKFMNGGTEISDNMYLIGEELAGIHTFNKTGKATNLQTNVTGYYLLTSRDRNHLYYATAGQKGLWKSSVSTLQKGKPNWEKIDSTKGLLLPRALTLTEDFEGNIWLGHPRFGISKYHPGNDQVQNWLLNDQSGKFGAMASLTDEFGHIWMGGNHGLWLLRKDRKRDANSFELIQHPLLNQVTKLTALSVYQEWIVIAAQDKMLLLNRDIWLRQRKAVVRYLSPYETAFTSHTEQNTLLTAKDSSIWWSTADMLYQWNIKQWLQLPEDNAQIEPELKYDSLTSALRHDQVLSLAPGTNDFSIQLNYYSRDMMPRYMRMALVQKGDTLPFSIPSTAHLSAFHNIAAGDYDFVVEMYEPNGNIQYFRFPIRLEKHYWQAFWFWPLVGLLLLTAGAYLLWARKKQMLAEMAAKQHRIDLEEFRTEQQRKLASLQLVALSSQFRPHFILNALNTIGAQMDDRPETETVLSRLGESVNLIFNHAQQQKTTHRLSDEWQLVKNVIQIHQLMYLKHLETNLPTPHQIAAVAEIQVPLGLLQIPVENALLHGLSNREAGPWILSIDILDAEDSVQLTITDNGVGRQKSATLSNFTKHGTGTKNLHEMVNIMNQISGDNIMIRYEDNILKSDLGEHGTRVIIQLSKPA